jgi:hypothetical protein
MPVDPSAADDCMDENAIWILPGRNAIAGTHRGWDAIREDFLAKVGACQTERSQSVSSTSPSATSTS